jgi:hypothetical protein
LATVALIDNNYGIVCTLRTICLGRHYSAF